MADISALFYASQVDTIRPSYVQAQESFDQIITVTWHDLARARVPPVVFLFDATCIADARQHLVNRHQPVFWRGYILYAIYWISFDFGGSYDVIVAG